MKIQINWGNDFVQWNFESWILVHNLACNRCKLCKREDQVIFFPS